MKSIFVICALTMLVQVMATEQKAELQANLGQVHELMDLSPNVAKLGQQLTEMQHLVHPIVQSHTYQHQWFRNLLMYVFIGFTLMNCSNWGIFYSFIFDIQGWYWDCLDNARTNLTLI